MEQITDFLEKLGMSEYAQRFAENGISVEALPHLTDQDLKDIGVLLGHRRVMLAAIAALSLATEKTVQPLPEAKPIVGAERRHVTVMFSDLVGSTALSARMDPEDLREVISDYQECVAETVRHFGGFVAKYMGDGVLVYFGFPLAHEDDPERAVRAGLELVAAVSSLKTHAPLQTRVGIATGLVVVGDLIGSGASQEQAIVGETPNLAARLQSIAEPNSVVIADSTRRFVGSLFELGDLGAKDLKGIMGSVRAWAALRTASVESRFEALHASGVTELVGREEEVDLLLRRWSKAKTGEGQLVLLSGEPGIGKSRLTAALLERVAAEPHARLRYFCSPQHTDSAFYPIIGQMERATGLTHHDVAQAKLDKLDTWLAQSGTPPPNRALFAELLSLPNDGRYPKEELEPRERRQRMLEALVAQLASLAEKRPVLMVFEDVHWIDPTSLEALDRAIDRIKSAGVLLIVTYRPEFGPPWIGRPYVTALTLNRLGIREVDAMIDRVTGDRRLPASVRQDIIERTDGIPLFVEEMTKAVLETESEGAMEGAIAAIPPPALGVPASLHGSLMARLDRLGTAKEIAQIGAVIGREFSHALLAAVARKPQADLEKALDRIVEAGLLLSRGVRPNTAYLFKHALVQDAAYSTLLREPRRALHADVVRALEDQFSGIAENQPELLARHCTEAGLVEKAATLWGKAGQRSLERSALVEAIEQLNRALAQIATLPASPELRRAQIRFQAALITPLIHVKGFAASETREAAARTRQLIEHADALGEIPEDPLLLFSVLFSFHGANIVAFDGDVSRDIAADFLAFAKKQGASVPLAIGHRLMGHSLMIRGDIAEGRAHYDRAISLYDPIEHRSLAARFGQDHAVTSLSYRSIAQWLLGYPEAALADANLALKAARKSGQVATLFFALGGVVRTYILCGDYAVANVLADEIVALAAEKGAVTHKALGEMYQSSLLALTGGASNALLMATAVKAALRSIGQRLFLPGYLSTMARAHANVGEYDGARRCIDEAMTAVEATGERWYEADIHRTAGELALTSPEPDATKAEAHFERALAIAHEQQAKSWELRAAMSLARLWREHGKRNDARELLAPIYGWFTEGFDTRDLKEAKWLLDDLTS
jgi:class 3 adenylate cyclase/predicted ATPase